MINVTVAVAILVGSATLAAWIVADVVVMVAGAVYSPLLEIDPTPVAGMIDQVTAMLAAPVMVVENCCACPWNSEAEAGVIGEILTAESVMVAVPMKLASVTLVAVTVTEAGAGMVAGAV